MGIKSSTVSFADVAHQSLSFDRREESSRLILELIDTDWVQRLRHIKQTGNTNLVYMFAEHSRFGHSLGVAYLANVLMDHLQTYSADLVKPYRNAVAAAAILHDIGHCAPGSHLAERVWAQGESKIEHEKLTRRIIREAPRISEILERHQVSEDVCRILSEDKVLPSWTHQMISGGGWNVDRGNWAIVDSAMCSVNYGRYNVRALIDAFRLTKDGQLVLRENRVDALTHFFVARDSMYRQVYQHRVLQAADALTAIIVKRIRDIAADPHFSSFDESGIFCDDAMQKALLSRNYPETLSLNEIYRMTEYWWNYHLERWCSSQDSVLRDLASRLHHRRLFKTIRLHSDAPLKKTPAIDPNSDELYTRAVEAATNLGLDPRYYVLNVSDELHASPEIPPRVLLENGDTVLVTDIEPLIASLLGREKQNRYWLAVAPEIKALILEGR